MDLKDLAAAELAWAISREETYKADGAPVPEPIRRLAGLAKAAQDAPRSGAAPSKALVSTIVDAGARLGIAGAAAPDGTISLDEAVIVVAEMEKMAANSEAIREVIGACDGALRGAAEILSGAREDLARLHHRGSSEGRPVADSLPSVSPVAESRAGQAACDRDAHSVQSSLPLPMVGAVTNKSGAEDTGILMRDWIPSVEAMAKSATDLATAMDKAGVKVEIDVPRLVEKFKAEKGSTSAKRPAMAFYAWACKTLRGG